jgi:hypothetical protein
MSLLKPKIPPDFLLPFHPINSNNNLDPYFNRPGFVLREAADTVPAAAPSARDLIEELQKLKELQKRTELQQLKQLPN